MKYDKSPETPIQAIQYALKMTKFHGVPWVAIRRIEPIDNRFALNFSAEPESEELIEGWERI